MIDALLATLERETEAEVARLLEDGRTRAAAAANESEARIAARKRQALELREAAGRAALEQALAKARHRARAQILAARGALLERVFAAVRELLPDVVTTAAYRDRLPAELERTLEFVGDEPVVLRCMPQLAPTLTRLVRSNGRLRIEPDATIAAGYRVVTAGGTLEVDATLEASLERLRPRLALAALAALAPAPGHAKAPAT
jgi:vacuolar-type H+-ATPase subunit E/Vma4